MDAPKSNLPRLIGLYSPRPSSGKSTVATYLTNAHGYKVVKFATPLKDMIRELLGHMGIPVQHIERFIEGDYKTVPIRDYGGVTCRRMMQTLGTEWGRNTILQSLWTDIALNKIRKYLAEGKNVVVDDLRFPNEYEALRSCDAHLWRIERPLEPAFIATGHASEGQLEGEQFPFDRGLFNGGTVSELYQKVGDTLLVSLEDTKSPTIG